MCYSRCSICVGKIVVIDKRPRKGAFVKNQSNLKPFLQCYDRKSKQIEDPQVLKIYWD